MNTTLYKQTNGLHRSDFTDLFGEECYILESGHTAEKAIWLGKFGQAMHLNKAMVEALLPLLTFFIETGSLSDDGLSSCGECHEWFKQDDIVGIFECPECGALNKDDESLCKECGFAPNAWLCSCGTYVEEACHCSNCGGQAPWGCDCGLRDDIELRDEDEPVVSSEQGIIFLLLAADENEGSGDE